MSINTMSGASGLIVVAALVSACTSGPDLDANGDGDTLDASAPGAEVAPVSPTPPMPAPLTAEFQRVGDGLASIVGSAIINETGAGSSQIMIQIMGLPDGAHAWHIHQGACGADGPVALAITESADAEALGEPLRPADDGLAMATVDVPGERLMADQMRARPYSIHVHQSTGASAGPAIACANILADTLGIPDIATDASS